MKRLLVFAAVVSVFSLGLTAHSGAERGIFRGVQGNLESNGGWGPDTDYSRMYDPRNLETLQGEVLSVEKVTPMRGMSQGVHLVVQTDRETLSVHLGPEWYLEEKGAHFEAGDLIEVTGSRAVFDGNPAIIAGKIEKGDETLILRDRRGAPAWSGRSMP